MEDKKNDVISNPDHYKLNGLDIEVRDVIKSVLGTVGFIGFYEGNIIKYILRASKKNGLEDYKKARQYLDWLIEELDEDAYLDKQLSFLEDVVDKEEPKEKPDIGIELLTKLPPVKPNKLEEILFGDDLMKNLSPKEAQEFNELHKKLRNSIAPLTKEETKRFNELVIKKYGTAEDIRENYRQNRENFLKLQEKINKKVTKSM